MRFELAWDGGVSDGDPGTGRIRVNAGAMRHATHFLINSRDRHGALVGEPVAKFWPGDVLHLERDGGGLIVAWVMGEVSHSGSYYKVPISVRSADGAFASDDLVTLHHQMDARATGRPDSIAPPDGRELTSTSAPTGTDLAIIAPTQLPQVAQQPPPVPALAPQAFLPPEAVQAPAPIVAPAATAPAYDEESLVKILTTMIHQLTDLKERMARVEQHALVGIDTNIEKVVGELAALQLRAG